MKLGIIGLGVLGSTYYHGYKYLGFNVKGYDKYKTGDVNTIAELFDTDAIFICLPTICDVNNNPDYTPFEDVLPQLNGYTGTIIVRSTMLPGETQFFADKYNLDLIHVPEFLTEKNAALDFFSPNRILIGLTEKLAMKYRWDEDNIPQWTVHLKELFKPFDVPVFITQSLQTEMAKIAANTMLAIKVTYANEMKNICDSVGINWENIVEMNSPDVRLAMNSHMTVTKEGGYSGMCLPKDTKQLINFAIKNNYNPEFFIQMDKSNNKFRGIKNE